MEADLFYFKTLQNGASIILTRPGTFDFFFNILSIYWSALLFYSMLRIHMESTENMKQISFWNFFATILIIIRGVFFYQIDEWMPGITFVMMCITVSILSMNFLRHPQLAFTLPYRILRISVIDMQSGMELFKKNWQSLRNTEYFNESTFANLLHGINLIIQETMQKGQIQEIHLEKGVVIMHHTKHSPYIFLLVATHTSKSLRNAIGKFAELFDQQFPDSEDKTFNLGRYSSAKIFVDACFPFVPEKY